MKLLIVTVSVIEVEVDWQIAMANWGKIGYKSESVLKDLIEMNLGKVLLERIKSS